MSGCLDSLASFPNTRERPRKPTLTSDTKSVSVAPQGSTGSFVTSGVVILPSDEGKITTMGNTVVKASDSERTYITLRNVDAKDAIVYGYRDRSDLNTTGMILRAGDSVDIDSLDTIFCRGLGVGSIDVRVDFGKGSL